MPEAPDYYELLGVDPDAGDDDVRAAHRRAAGYWHPDRNRAPNAAEMMRHVNNARDTLLSATKRRDYNLGSRIYREWASRRSAAAQQSVKASNRARENRQRQAWQREESRGREERARQAQPGDGHPASARNRGGKLSPGRLFVRLQPSRVMVPLLITGLTVAAGYVYINYIDDSTDGAGAIRLPTESPSAFVPSSTAERPVPTPSAVPGPVPTAPPAPEPTPLPASTPTQPVPTAIPTAPPTATPTATPTPVPSLLTGPLSGDLTRFDASSPLGVFGSAFDTGISAASFKIEVRFENRFAAFTPGWSYGIVFRRSAETEHVLAIRGDGTWQHLTGAEVMGSGRFQDPPYIEVITSVSLLVAGDRALLIVNNAFSGVLDLSEGPHSGGIVLVQGVFPRDDLTGSVTRFLDLKITEMTALATDSTGFITVGSEPVSLSERTMHARNAVMTAEFLSPYASFSGNWSFGFRLRESAEGAARYVVITDSKEWLNYRRESADADPEPASRAAVEALNVAGGAYSRLTVILDGAAGYVLVNDLPVTIIGLADHDHPGANGPLAAFFAGDQPPGSRAEYRNLEIWEFDE